MKFSEQWLREWVNAPIDTEQLAAQLTMAGLEVDGVEAVAPAFSGVVVAEVLSVSSHPDAEKLKVCQVSAGGSALQIVCGAANVRPGLRVPLATVGAQLPGGLSIKAAKLRGIESNGMLCSASELGLSETASGLLELPADASTGCDIRDYMQLDDRTIELGLTPNRADCLSIRGVAREVAVLNRVPLHAPEIPAIPAQHDESVEIDISAPAQCPAYCGRVIRGINPDAHTPMWMQERLRRSGIRSLGPIVDVTNYVMLELGQPMHAFDLGKLAGGIRVRMAANGEQLTLLNGQEINLHADTLVIADRNKPLALAGVMGGQDSAVDATTRDLFLESAFFAPEYLAGKARRYGLHTDSSHRFERGVDPELQQTAIERATALILAIAGGAPGPLLPGRLTGAAPRRDEIILRAARLEQILGTSTPTASVTDILGRLGFQITEGQGSWRVKAPSFRFDIEREVDLIEEVARITGYSQLPTRRPLYRAEMQAAPEGTVTLAQLRDTLVQRGYQETITYSFVEPGLDAMLGSNLAGIRLANPISEDMSQMRTGLWPGLISAVQHNLNRQQDRIHIFESGMRYFLHGNDIVQENMISAAASGSADPEQWASPSRMVDFFDIKGDVEALIALTGCSNDYRFLPAAHPALHPGRSARIEHLGATVGWVGALHPDLQQKLGIAQEILLFELLRNTITERKLPKYKEISRFPAIVRDFALVVDRGVTASQIKAVVEKNSSDTLKNFQLFDVYDGKGIDSGKKSVAFRLTLQSSSRTLDERDVDAVMTSMLSALKSDLGATLRE